ncbi:hypothetical protein Agau_P200306 (plasmid) [Agrobacterium tumefaciens F2]|jgi:hypothetical protein|nr:hypothetical protein Agau_P200306 [Agrobacterium tumefaciens F2]
MPGLSETASGNASTSVVKGKRIPTLRGLQIGGRHLARLAVALELETNLLTFDEFAHSGALDGRDVNEGVSAAVVRLDETEALGGIEPFHCASGHNEPFQSIEQGTAKRMPRGQKPTIFERKVRLERGANRAMNKARQAKDRWNTNT